MTLDSEPWTLVWTLDPGPCTLDKNWDATFGWIKPNVPRFVQIWIRFEHFPDVCLNTPKSARWFFVRPFSYDRSKIQKIRVSRSKDEILGIVWTCLSEVLSQSELSSGDEKWSVGDDDSDHLKRALAKFEADRSYVRGVNGRSKFPNFFEV